MGDIRSKSKSIAVVVEDTEGTYKAPTAGTDYIQVVVDGDELNGSKSYIDRNVYTGSIGKVSGRVGQTEASGALKVELKAADTTGLEPEMDKLLKAALGSKRQVVAGVTIAGSTTSKLNVADASPWNVGDTILIGKTHVSPIIAVDTVLDTLELLVPTSAPTGTGVEIAALTTYTVAETGHDSLSITRYYEGKVRQWLKGAKVSGFTLEGFEVGTTPTMNFTLDAQGFDSDLHNQVHNPSYDSQLPPIILEQIARMDGAIIHCEGISFACENTISKKTSVNAANGILSTSVVERSFSGSFAPYAADDSIANYTRFKNETPFSLFFSMYLPGANPGEKKAVCSFYLPNCVAKSFADTNKDGLITNEIEFTSDKGTDGSKTELYISFS